MAVFDLTIKLRDAFKRKSRRTFQVSAVDYATAVTAAASFLTDYKAFTEAEVLEYVLGTTTSGSDAPVAGANIDEGITFSMETTLGKTAPVKVPAPTKAELDGVGNADLSGALTAALLSHFTSGFVLVSDGETVAQVIKGTLDK